MINIAVIIFTVQVIKFNATTVGSKSRGLLNRNFDFLWNTLFWLKLCWVCASYLSGWIDEAADGEEKDWWRWTARERSSRFFSSTFETQDETSIVQWYHFTCTQMRWYYIIIIIYVSVWMCKCRWRGDTISVRCVTYFSVIGAVNRSCRRRIEPLYSHGSMDSAMVRVERREERKLTSRWCAVLFQVYTQWTLGKMLFVRVCVPMVGSGVSSRVRERRRRCCWWLQLSQLVMTCLFLVHSWFFVSLSLFLCVVLLLWTKINWRWQCSVGSM